MSTCQAYRRIAVVVAMAAIIALPASLAGCSVVEDVLDPVHASQVAALGEDPSGQRNGPTHRPGQPCLVCHGGLGPGRPDLSVGGTIYETKTNTTALSGATVTLTDAQKTVRQLMTNRTGNFLVDASAWQPVYPLLVSVSYRGVSIDMKTHVGRDGSCATCHTDPSDATSAGHVFLVEDPTTFPAAP